MALSLGRIKYFTIGLIKDAISWTPAPLDDKMKTTLVDCLRIAQDKNFKRDDFMKVRGMLTQGGLYTAPPMPEDEGRFHEPGEVGFGGMVTYACPKHGNVVWCDCKDRQPVKKYRIINLDTNAEWEADTSAEVWRIIYTEISNLDTMR